MKRESTQAKAMAPLIKAQAKWLEPQEQDFAHEEAPVQQ